MSVDYDGLFARRLARRDFMRYAAVLGGAGVLAACRRAETPPSAGGTEVVRAPIEDEPGILEVFDWDGYGDGEAGYGDEALWKLYAKAFPNQAPEFTKFKDDDSSYARVAAGDTFDVAHPCGYRWPDWVALDVLQPWDTSLISSFADLNPTLTAPGQFDGQQYFITTDWGFAAPMYRSDLVEPSEDSWGILWDERYKDRISWWDSLNMLVVAAYYNGIPDPWAMTDEELGQMRDFLASKIGLVRTLWPIDPSEDFINEDVWITYAWPSHWVYAYIWNELTDTVYMEPKEGRTSWYCGFALFADTENYYHAHEYVNAWASPQAAEWLLSNYGYGHTNTALDLAGIDPGIVEAFSLDDPSVLEEPRSHVERPIERRDVYNDIWEEVKAAAA
jgi:spermidine/putrescine-binding protein